LEEKGRRKEFAEVSQEAAARARRRERPSRLARGSFAHAALHALFGYQPSSFLTIPHSRCPDAASRDAIRTSLLLLLFLCGLLLGRLLLSCLLLGLLATLSARHLVFPPVAFFTGCSAASAQGFSMHHLAYGISYASEESFFDASSIM
jgi:hypothetical protein